MNELLVDSTSRVLVVGDGNLSFAASLVTAGFVTGSNLTATVYDNDPVAKYQAAKHHVETLEAAGALVRFSIDARRLQHEFPEEKYDRIVFMHPLLAGDGYARFNPTKWLLANKVLLFEFLLQCRTMLRDQGRVCITIKNVYPYAWWDIGAFCEWIPGMRLEDRVEFSAAKYTGYETMNVDRDCKIKDTAATTFRYAVVDTKPEDEFAEEDEELVCKACKKRFSGPGDHSRHMLSRKHTQRQALHDAWMEWLKTSGYC